MLSGLEKVKAKVAQIRTRIASSRLTDEQLIELEKPLLRSVIREKGQEEKPKGAMTYVEGWYVIGRANNIFGYDGWSSKIISLTQAYFEPYEKGHNAVYVCHMQLTFCKTIQHEDVGVGSGYAKQPLDAIEGAAKEAVTDALKRCLRYLGNQFGLPLYDLKRRGVETDEDVAERTGKKGPVQQEASQKEDAGGTSAGPAKQPQPIDPPRDPFYEFLGACEEEKKRVGARLYYTVLNEENLLKSNVVSKRDTARQSKLLKALRDTPGWYTPEGSKLTLDLIADQYCELDTAIATGAYASIMAEYGSNGLDSLDEKTKSELFNKLERRLDKLREEGE